MVFSIITYPTKGAGFPRVCLFILGQGFDADKVNRHKKIYRAVKSVLLPNSRRPVDSRYASQNHRHRQLIMTAKTTAEQVKGPTSATDPSESTCAPISKTAAQQQFPWIGIEIGLVRDVGVGETPKMMFE
jgi:hypothetical protein